jgi:hypothetical protein
MPFGCLPNFSLPTMVLVPFHHAGTLFVIAGAGELFVSLCKLCSVL